MLTTFAALLVLGAPAVAQAAFINATATAGNFTSTTQNFTFGFTQPLGTPLTGLVSYSMTISADLTDGRNDGINVSPFNGSFVEGLLNGVSVDSDSLAALTADLPSTLVFSGLYDCGAGCNTMALSLHFSLTPFDIASFSALFTVEEAQVVPEPRTVALLLPALLLLAAARRARARTG